MDETGSLVRQVIVKRPAVYWGRYVNYWTGEIESIVQYEDQRIEQDSGPIILNTVYPELVEVS